MEIPQDILSKLDEIMICAVCLAPLPADVGGCVNGHVFCTPCKEGVNDCPTCRSDLLDNKPTLVSQIIEAFPQRCKYEGCKVVRTRATVEAHERRCKFRQTKCNICNWTGTVDDLLDHAGAEHSLQVSTKKQILSNFDFEDFDITMPSVYHDTFFWRCVKVYPELNRVNFKFTSVPPSELNASFQAILEFRSEDAEHIAKVNMNNDGEIVISFDSEMLKPFLSSDKNLTYFLTMKKIPIK